MLWKRIDRLSCAHQLSADHCCCLNSPAGNKGTLHFYLNNYTDIDSLNAAVLSIPYLGGNTNTTGGLRVMRTQIFNTANGDRPSVPNVCLLITDGVPTREVEDLADEVQMVRAAGIRVIGIGVTNAVSAACFAAVTLLHEYKDDRTLSQSIKIL